METIFDYNPTAPEIEEHGFLHEFSLSIRHGIEFTNPLTSDSYRQSITGQAAAFDLYLLFLGRGDQLKAADYVARVHDKVAEHRHSVACQQIEKAT